MKRTSPDRTGYRNRTARHQALQWPCPTPPAIECFPETAPPEPPPDRQTRPSSPTPTAFSSRPSFRLKRVFCAPNVLSERGIPLPFLAKQKSSSSSSPPRAVVSASRDTRPRRPMFPRSRLPLPLPAHERKILRRTQGKEH